MTIQEWRHSHCGGFAPPRGNQEGGYLAYAVGPVKVAQMAADKRKLGTCEVPSSLKEAVGVAQTPQSSVYHPSPELSTALGKAGYSEWCGYWEEADDDEWYIVRGTDGSWIQRCKQWPGRVPSTRIASSDGELIEWLKEAF